MSDQLDDDIVSDLNEQLSDVSARKASDDLEFDLRHAISTGLEPLDLLLGGGLFPGRMYEVAGEESHGKSTLSYHMMAEYQKKDGVVILLENESALDKDRAEIIGVNTDDVLILNPKTFEQGASAIFNSIERVRERIPDRPVLVVWDTIAAASTQTEIDAIRDGADKWAGGQAEKPRQIRKWTRVITPKISETKVTILLLNQVYSNIGGGYGSRDFKTPGGRGIRHHCSARLFIKRRKAIQEEKKPIGFDAHLEAVKNKQAPTDGREVRIPLMFEDGLDDAGGIYYYVKDRELVDVAGNGYVSFQLDGEDRSVQGRKNMVQTIREESRVQSYFRYLMYRDFYERYDQLKKRLYGVVKEEAEEFGDEPPELPEVRVQARKFKRMYREDSGEYIDVDEALRAVKAVREDEGPFDDVRDVWSALTNQVQDG